MDVDRIDRTRARRGKLSQSSAIVALFVSVGISILLAPPQTWLNAGPDEAGVPKADEPLVDVRIEGNTTIPAAHIAKYIRTRAGRPYSEKQIQDDVKGLFGTRWFFSVEPQIRRTQRGLVLIFRVIERPVVVRVEYHGNKQIKDAHLGKITGLKKGSPYSVAANRESARRIQRHYHEKGYVFAKVRLTRGDRQGDHIVVFQIDEGPKVRVTSVKYTGNNFVSGPVLMTKIRTTRAILWLIGGTYDPATVPDDVAALKQYYYNLGFFDIDVKSEKQFSKDRSRVTLVYHIKEGPRYKIRDVEFRGNQVLGRRIINESTKLRAGDYFSALKLAKDIDALKGKYGEMGRIFAKVEAAPRFLESEPGVADLVYRIDEDRIFRIRRINVIFRDRVPHTRRSAVLNRMLVHPGDLANPKLIRRSELKIKGVQIFADGRRNPAEAPQISIRRVKEGLPERFVRGQNAGEFLNRVRPPSRRHNSQSDRRRRRRTASYFSGENPFDLSTLRPDGSERQVPVQQQPATRPAVPDTNDVLPFTDGVPPAFHFRGGKDTVFRGQSFQNGVAQPGSPLFNNDPNNPIGGANREGNLDLDVQVSETQTGRLMFGVGVNSDAGVVGSIVLNEYNFDILRPPLSWQDLRDGTAWRGGGQRLRLEAVPGNIVSRYLASWTAPYFLDTDYSLSLSGFYYNRFLPNWDEQRTGGRVSVGRQWTPEISSAVNSRLENVELSNPDLPTPGLLAAGVGHNLLFTLGFSVAHDTRDQAFLPGSGHLMEFNFEHALGDFNYPRMVLSGSQYFTVYQRPDELGRHILTLRGQAGWTDAGTPIFERFYAGGFQTFRGFDFRGVTPRMFGIGIGGRWMAVGTVEYMLPLMANESIQGVAFSDFGTVENDVGFDDFRLTVGLGLRITIPAMGPVPLAFDFGFPLLDQPFDDRRVFNFYVGITR